MAEGQYQEPEGSLIRGADGALYFIPDDQLQAFRLPEAQATEAARLFDLGGEPGLVSGRIRGPEARRLGLRVSDASDVGLINLGALRHE
jgi:hypothetical protein